MSYKQLSNYYSGRRVFITGHTGFKGSWLCYILNLLGADVYGYSLNPVTEPNLYKILNIDKFVHSTIGDIRDFENLKECLIKANPECIIHLAAQPIVRESYRVPRETYEVNVMGTVNILECARFVPNVKSILNVTTDKVYENDDTQVIAFREDDKLDGHDPYSNSKSCSEILTHSYKKSFFSLDGTAKISTARAGNVIGGGDYAEDRIIPDCVRKTTAGESINIRNPHSVRPYQHVLEPLMVYLTIVMKQDENSKYEGYFNIGPDIDDCITSSNVAEKFVLNWGENSSWSFISDQSNLHEANFLKLDCSKLKETFGWEATWEIDEAIRETVLWYKAWSINTDMQEFTYKQILKFLNEMKY